MGYWKTKVLPKLKKVFEKNGNKKAAAEACKTFDESKEAINTAFEEQKTELQPKVLEIYEASSTEIKALVKDPKEADVKKNSATVHLFLLELTKIEFPGAKPVSEISEKFGAGLVPGPVIFILDKVSPFVVATKDKGIEVSEITPAAPEPAEVVAGEPTVAEPEEIKAEVVVEEVKTTEPAPAPAPEPAKP